ncbi:hypothetical protein AeRB84_004123 [Aphanomyces euteiches]|nr:hypothetical protein AeRB84_004123 [Aphanomyces euteiches]
MTMPSTSEEERHLLVDVDKVGAVQSKDLAFLPGVTERTVNRAKTVVGVLVAVNVVMWLMTFVASSRYPVILSPALVAYSLGLRHAVDADHIAAIDNVTRNLLQRGQQPVTVGLFFSLGHSSVVILMSLVVIFSASYFDSHIDDSKAIGAIIGTVVSATFLCLIGLLNAFSFARLYRAWHNVSTKEVEDETNEPNVQVGGAITGFCPSLLGVVDWPWKMYPLGFLFGLGFDTASEVALLAISAIASHSGVPSWLVLVLPGLFTCGMSLVDTLDGIFMLWAYGWAYIHPAKKLFYNMFLTGLSSFVALFIGIVEALGIVVSQTNWSGWLADGIQSIKYKNFVTDVDETQKPSELFKQAVFAFDGPAYKGLQSDSWSDKDIAFAQDHLRILCGLYGTLRPLDLIQAYRLEMGQKVSNPRGKDLYNFWGCTISEDINKAFESSSASTKILLNVASIEYFKSVDLAALDPSIVVVDCVFKDDGQIKSVYAKRARGLMVHYVVKSQASTLEDIQAFNMEGYQYSAKESTSTTLVFNRSKAALKRAVEAGKAPGGAKKSRTK